MTPESNPTSTSAQMIGTTLSGRYKLEAKLGSGGMSTVYLARDETLDRPVAVKLMHREMSEQPDQLHRFRQEARSVAKLSHSNVVSVIDAGEDGGHPYIIFEYVEGETLKQRIYREGPLEVQDAVAYAIEIARGLAVAHGRQMVHRDIKPQNVLIDTDGHAKVTDFGIARQLEQAGVTATGRVLGTTDYVSPEQAMGRQVDPRSDIYSLGVVLFEMLTGDVPFHADSLVGVAMKHVNEELPDVQSRRPEVSAAVALALERATAKLPEERHQRIEEFIDDLETALEVEATRSGKATGEATSVLEAVPPPRRKLKRGRRWSWTGALLLLVATGAAIGAVVLLSGDDGPAGSIPGDAEEVGLVGATDFDPEGGDGENPEETGFAIDDNPTGTAWTTETYEQPDFGKDGVGVYVDAGEPVAASLLAIRSIDPGWELEVYGATEPPPDDLDGWRLIGTAGVDQTSQQVEINDREEEFRYYLLWATEPAESDEGYEVRISDIRLFQ